MEKFSFYSDIKHLVDTTGKVPYELLLNTFEWRDFREKILKRDNYTCSNCQKLQTLKLNPGDKGYFREPTQKEKDERSRFIVINWIDGTTLKMRQAPIIGIPIKNPIILHVHHLYYIWEHLPWEYELDALISVCHRCHVEIHKTQKIPVYFDDNLVNEVDLTPCSRCFGTGFLEQFSYFHDGICFACMGNKYVLPMP